MTLRLWMTWLLLVSVPVQADEITHFIIDSRVGARMQGLSYPESLRTDLRSGLTTRLLMRVTLLQGEQPRDMASVEIALKYDLWDELFHVELSINGAAASTPQLRTVEEAIAWLNDLRLPALFDVPANAGTFVLKAEALMNPVERERLELIRKWVKENSSYVPVDGAARSSTSESGSNAILNRIFEHYASSDDVAAQWRREVTSAPFSASAR